MSEILSSLLTPFMTLTAHDNYAVNNSYKLFLPGNTEDISFNFHQVLKINVLESWYIDKCGKIFSLNLLRL